VNIELTYDNRTAKLKIAGNLTPDNSNLFQEKLDEVLNSDADFLKLDLQNCQNMSSIGVGKILLFCRNFRAKGGDMEVTKCSPEIYELFNMLKLNQLFTVNQD